MKRAELVEPVWRLGRRPDPWSWPDWAYAGSDGTFGNRFDDPLAVYRVLYASTERLATFVECLAVFRPDPEVLTEYALIQPEADDDEPPAAGVLPVEWFDGPRVGHGRPEGAFVELGHHETLAALRLAMSARVVHHGIGDLDAAAIRVSVPRTFTQEVGRYVYERTVAGRRQWDGIVYRSRYGDDLENWAFFEPAAPTEQGIWSFRFGRSRPHGRPGAASAATGVTQQSGQAMRPSGRRWGWRVVSSHSAISSSAKRTGFPSL